MLRKFCENSKYLTNVKIPYIPGIHKRKEHMCNKGAKVKLLKIRPRREEPNGVIIAKHLCCML